MLQPIILLLHTLSTFSLYSWQGPNIFSFFFPSLSLSLPHHLHTHLWKEGNGDQVEDTDSCFLLSLLSFALFLPLSLIQSTSLFISSFHPFSKNSLSLSFSHIHYCNVQPGFRPNNSDYTTTAACSILG